MFIISTTDVICFNFHAISGWIISISQILERNLWKPERKWVLISIVDETLGGLKSL
jgi:hypothetical protein